MRGSGCGPTVPAKYSIPDFTKKVLETLYRSAKKIQNETFKKKICSDGHPFSLAALASSPKGAPFEVEVKFPAKPQSLRARSLPLGGAVAQRLRGYEWRSEKSVKAIAPTGAALAFLCFDFFFRIVKGV